MSAPESYILPLGDLHEAAGARFGDFAGWRMPLTYPLGVLKEHLWTREHAGLFDISHMRLFSVRGTGAAALLKRACPIDPEALEPGQSKLTFFLNETAGILDDLIVTRLGSERFMVVANAGNAASDERHLREVGRGFEAAIEVLPPRHPSAWLDRAMGRGGNRSEDLRHLLNGAARATDPVVGPGRSQQAPQVMRRPTQAHSRRWPNFTRFVSR